MEREVGGGIGKGNTCKPKAVSFQCMTKPTTKKKKDTSMRSVNLELWRDGQNLFLQASERFTINFWICPLLRTFSRAKLSNWYLYLTIQNCVHSKPLLQRKLENNTAPKSEKGRIACRPKVSPWYLSMKNNKLILEIFLRSRGRGNSEKSEVSYFYIVVWAGR